MVNHHFLVILVHYKPRVAGLRGHGFLPSISDAGSEDLIGGALPTVVRGMVDTRLTLTGDTIAP